MVDAYFDLDTPEFVQHEPCPECGSKDNLARYSDGHGYCFGCGYYEHHEGDIKIKPKGPKRRSMKNLPGVKHLDLDYRAIPARNLTEDTCRLFGYGVTGTMKGPAQVAVWKTRDGDAKAYQLRYPDKSFAWAGDHDVKARKCVLWGQHLWKAGGRRVVITEGAIDAMVLSQVQDNKWPVVAVMSTENAPYNIANSLDWLEGFDEVVFAFDNDEPGQKAAKKCAEMITPGKAKIARLPAVDPDECVKKGLAKELIDSIWQANEFRPDGLVTLEELIARGQPKPIMGVSWPWPTLTDLTYGRRPGELYVIGGGTASGKTTFTTQIIAHTLTENHEAVALFFFEQPPQETLLRLSGMAVGKILHVPAEEGDEWPEQDYNLGVDMLRQAAPLILCDHWGAAEWENVKNRISYCVQSTGVKHVFVDHLTALSAQADDERRYLDGLMEEAAALAQRLRISLYLISHLNTPDGVPHEEGGRVMARHFRGSRAIQQWAHMMLGIERNQQHSDADLQKIINLRVLKDRYTGRANGKVIALRYDDKRGDLTETGGEPPDLVESKRRGAKAFFVGKAQGGNKAETVEEAF